MNDATPAMITLTAAILTVLRFRVACAIRVRGYDEGGAFVATTEDALAALHRGAHVVTFGIVRGETQPVEQIVIQPNRGKRRGTGSSTRYVVDLIPVVPVEHITVPA